MFRILFLTLVTGLVVSPAVGEEPPPMPDGTPVDITTVDLSPTYPWDQNKDAEKIYPPEDPQTKADVKWRTEMDCEDGVVDLAHHFNQPSNVVVYVRVLLEAVKDGQIFFSMGSDDGLTVIANGQRVLSVNKMRGMQKDSDRITVDLKKGRNELLFRITQGGGGFSFCVSALALGGLDVAQIHAPMEGKARFSFTLENGAQTSAGIFDSEGRLVRSLWARRKFTAGSQEGAWDGNDDQGKACTPGGYTWKVIVNGADYRCVGAIGNSGMPSNAKTHTPTAMHDVAVDADGGVYTVNFWDEAGADFKKWDKDGNSIYDAQYQMRNGCPNGAPYACATDDQYLYCTMEGWAGEQWKQAQQVQRFRLSDGKAELFTETGREDGHIQIYENPEKLIPAGTPEADAELMHWPLRDIEVLGDTLLVADTLGGRVLRFHKVTGKPEGEFKVKLPTALAVDKAGKVWVGHERSKVSIFSADGKLERQVLSDLGVIKSLTFGPDGKLYIADEEAGQVKIYNVSGAKAKRVKTFGQKAKSGDRAADRFFRLRGAAVDREGCLITIQNEPTSGARVARWSSDGKLLWEHFGTVFVSLANYGAYDTDTAYSMHFHKYRLKDHNKGEWEYVGNTFSGEGRGYMSDTHGVPRLLKLKGNEFFFIPTGDGVQVYRQVEGVFQLVSLLGGGSPNPEGKVERDGNKVGKWTWTATETGKMPKPDEIRWFKKPGEQGHQYAVFGMDIDAQGSLWFGELHSHAIWTVPIKELNAAGNPVYDWADAKLFAKPGEGTVKFEQFNMVQHADDGSVYTFGWSKAWPSPKNNPFWMGGTTLARYDATGKMLWAVPLRATCVGLDVIPGGGGCFAGSGYGATIYHYSGDGLLLGALKPGKAMGNESGWLDNHASVAVGRDSHDGMLDVFTEDDYTLRIGWYRVDDKNISELKGSVKLE